MSEPEITINGTALDEGQAMAVRVACTSMHTELIEDENAIGDDLLGHQLRDNYIARIEEIYKIMGIIQ